ISGSDCQHPTAWRRSPREGARGKQLDQVGTHPAKLEYKVEIIDPVCQVKGGLEGGPEVELRLDEEGGEGGVVEERAQIAFGVGCQAGAGRSGGAYDGSAAKGLGEVMDLGAGPLVARLADVLQAGAWCLRCRHAVGIAFGAEGLVIGIQVEAKLARATGAE